MMGSSVGNHTCSLRVSSSASLALLCPRGTSGAAEVMGTAEVMLTLCVFELPFGSSACKRGTDFSTTNRLWCLLGQPQCE